EILNSNASLELVEIQEGTRIENNKIYLMNQGVDIEVDGNIFNYKNNLKSSVHPNLTRIFKSIAFQHHERSVGILLSGCVSDGVQGLLAIKSHGGLAIVQEPHTSQFDLMPQTAINSSAADFVLAPEDIPDELFRLINAKAKEDVSNSKLVATLMTKLKDCTGHDFSEFKKTTLERRIKRRLTITHVSSLEKYLDLVEKEPIELEALSRDLQISVTAFFRDPQAFTELKKSIEEIVARKERGQTIRVWVPGCATGEEVYSIAILFAEVLAENFNRFSLKIFATDIDIDALSKARQGIYNSKTLKGVNPQIKNKYFDYDQNSDSYRVVGYIRESVLFTKHNLVQDPPFLYLDLISCRNLMIYFSSKLQSRLIPIFHYGLKDNGYLFLGKAEGIRHRTDLFEVVDITYNIYCKTKSINYSLASLQLRNQFHFKTNKGETSLPSNYYHKKTSLKDIVNNAIANNYAPPSILIDEGLNVVYTKGNIQKFISIKEGEHYSNIIDLAHEDLKVPLRTSISKCIRERKNVETYDIRFKDGDDFSYCNIFFRPVDNENAEEQGYWILISFEIAEQDKLEISDGKTATQDWKDYQIDAMEKELTNLHQQLHDSNEELENSNVELQSLNEEFNASNEELQLANEELETTNEELQAINEELTNVNNQLSIKTDELASLNFDLENMLKCIDIPLVIVDKKLKIRKFTFRATSVFKVDKNHINNTVTSLESIKGLSFLNDLLETAVVKGEIANREIEWKGRFYQISVYPYHGDNDIVGGAIIAFYDNTEILRSKEDFASLAESAPDIIVRYDQNYKHIYINPIVEKYTGLKPIDFMGKTSRELGMPEDLCNYWEDIIDATILTKKSQTAEFSFDSPSGKIFFGRRTSLEKQEYESGPTVLMITRDLTDLKRAQEKLKESEQKFAIAFKSNPIPISITERATGFFFEVNQAFSDLVGIKIDDLIGKTTVEIGFWETIDERDRMQEKIKRQAETVTIEKNFKHSDGSIHTGLFSFAWTIIEGRERIITSAMEITKIRRLEKEREDLLMSISDGFFSLDNNLDILYFNQAAGEILEKIPESVMGKNILEVFPEAKNSYIMQMYEKALREKISMRFENYFPPHKKWYQIRVYPRHNGISVFFRDTTKEKQDQEERKKLENDLNQTQKLTSIGTLAGGIAHEFNNILAAIMGYSELSLHFSKKGKDHTNHLENIINVSKRARNLIQEILTFSRKVDVQMRNINVNDEIKKITQLVENIFPKSISIELNLEENIGFIYADPTQLEQILLNLSTNARDAMPEGGKVTICSQKAILKDVLVGSQTDRIGNNEYIKISVSDEGVGIDENTKERIFDPFFTTKDVGMGTGLGLSIVYGIVKRHGGRIKCHTAINKGTTFEVFFPVVSKNPSQNTKSTINRVPVGGNETIFLIDDEKDLLIIEDSFLTEAGYKVLATQGGVSAIKAMKQYQFNIDLVIIDLNMPEMSGKQCLQQILKFMPNVKVLLVSGQGESFDEQEFQGLQHSGFLAKPFDRVEFLNKVRTILDTDV
ncbi:MAG: CheR family methyltransferase, partial [Bacteriovoracia bacterium]